MPASEILRIITTVATVQLVCDLISYWRVFSREPYQRSVEKLERLKFKWDQIQTKEAGTVMKKSGRKQEQNNKKVQRAEGDYKNALANVTRRHMVPNILTSVVFLIMMKVLGAELKGHIIAILPFEPFSLLRKITTRNLEFNDGAVAAMAEDATTKVVQACSFTFIYMLSSMTAKFYVHQLFGYKAPHGATLTSLAESPMGQNSKYSAVADFSVGPICMLFSKDAHNNLSLNTQ